MIDSHSYDNSQSVGSEMTAMIHPSFNSDSDNDDNDSDSPPAPNLKSTITTTIEEKNQKTQFRPNFKTKLINLKNTNPMQRFLPITSTF